MRAEVVVGLLAFWYVAGPDSYAADPPPRPRNLLLFVADGLRAGMINDHTAPAMTALLKRGVTFTNTHAVFPSTTMSNAAAMATGHFPGDTGAFGNTVFAGFAVPAAGGSMTPSLASDTVLSEVDGHFAGNALGEETILRAAAATGLSTASVGMSGPGLTFDHAARTGQQTIVVDDQTGHPGGVPLTPDVQLAFREFGLVQEAPPRGEKARAAAGATAGAGAGPAEQDWFADVASLALLPTFRDRHKPFVMVFWSPDPAATQQDQGDSQLRLVPGINGSASLAAVREADNALGKLLTALKELGLEATTDVIVASDH